MERKKEHQIRSITYKCLFSSCLSNLKFEQVVVVFFVLEHNFFNVFGHNSSTVTPDCTTWNYLFVWERNC